MIERLKTNTRYIVFVITSLFLAETPILASADTGNSEQIMEIDPFFILPYIIIPILAFVFYYFRTQYLKRIQNFDTSLQNSLTQLEHDLSIKHTSDLAGQQQNHSLEVQAINNSHQTELTGVKQEAEMIMKQKELEDQKVFQAKIKAATKRSNDTQRVVIKGKTAEQMAPWLPEFCEKYTPADARFFGSPFDFLIIQGMTEFNGGLNDIKLKIIFLDIKTGRASLNPLQTAFKEAVDNGRVDWDTMKLKSIEKFNKTPLYNPQVKELCQLGNPTSGVLN